MKRKHLLKLVAVIALTSSTLGCASRSQVREALNEADQSKRIAEQALNTANEAREAAQKADARSKQTEEMLNRSFKKSMYK